MTQLLQTLSWVLGIQPLRPGLYILIGKEDKDKSVSKPSGGRRVWREIKACGQQVGSGREGVPGRVGWASQAGDSKAEAACWDRARVGDQCEHVE